MRMTVRLARSDADGVGVPDAAEAEIVFPKRSVRLVRVRPAVDQVPFRVSGCVSTAGPGS